MERKPSTNELERWGHDPAQPRQVLAQWYLAKSALRSGDRDKAMARLTQLRDSPVRVPSLGEADLELARLHMAKEEWDEAIAAAEAARGTKFRSGFRGASGLADCGSELPQRASRPGRAPLRSNWRSVRPPWRARLCLTPPFAGCGSIAPRSLRPTTARLAMTRPSRPCRESCSWRKAPSRRRRAKRRRSRLFKNSSAIFRRVCASPRPWVSLAELAFHAPRPDLEAARKDLARARQERPTPAALERADYLQIWLEDATSSTDERPVITAASNFLRQYQDSRFTAEVRMKLAEAYFRRQDFANAQTQFELLAKQNPNAALTEKALFFAARSAMSSMGAESLDHALALLDQAVKLNGELRWAARNEEAAIERRLGKNREALALYDEVLKNDAKPAERREALCGKGDISYEMGVEDAKNYQRAIEFTNNSRASRACRRIGATRPRLRRARPSRSWTTRPAP